MKYIINIMDDTQAIISQYEQQLDATGKGLRALKNSRRELRSSSVPGTPGRAS